GFRDTASASSTAASPGRRPADPAWTSPAWASSSSSPTRRPARWSGRWSRSCRRIWRRLPRRVKLSLQVQGIVHGGETLARHEGRVVFLRGAAPGDVVEVELTGEGRFERARPLRILQRGGIHVDPPCAIVDRCGGCPVQHVAYEAQLAAKQELAADALERIGGFARNSYELAAIVP